MKCETLKEYTINKITTSKSGSDLDDSIFKEINRCKKIKRKYRSNFGEVDIAPAKNDKVNKSQN